LLNSSTNLPTKLLLIMPTTTYQTDAISLVSLVDDVNKEQEIEQFTYQLIERLQANYDKQYPQLEGQTYHDPVRFEVKRGRKFLKVIQTKGGVHAFIDKKTGDVFKPASWNKPAQHVRYNLLDNRSRTVCFERADWAGGYLYLR